MKKTIIITFAGLFLLSSCGQTGPLYLPEKASPEAEASAAKASTPAKPNQANVEPKNPLQ